MFSWYKYLIVSLVFSHLGFWSGSLFLIAPFPDLCLLVLFFFQEFSRQKRLYNGFRFMLYHKRERGNKANANFVYIVYLLAKLCNILDETFLLTSVYIGFHYRSCLILCKLLVIVFHYNFKKL